jgi:hypothetical protein
VKFLKADSAQFLFQVGRREKSLLLDLLKLYPVVPGSHHQISHTGEGAETEANQKLLEEALAEHRNENKRALEAMISEAGRFQETSTGFILSLSSEQLEWLLQVLNDVRVGSWLELGSPDEKQGKRLRLSLQNARYLWAMELSGHFQYALLAARRESGESH